MEACSRHQVNTGKICCYKKGYSLHFRFFFMCTIGGGGFQSWAAAEAKKSFKQIKSSRLWKANKCWLCFESGLNNFQIKDSHSVIELNVLTCLCSLVTFWWEIKSQFVCVYLWSLRDEKVRWGHGCMRWSTYV